MAARVAGSPARWRTMKVMSTDDVSWPATRTTMALSTISSSVSSRWPPAPSSARRLTRQLRRSSAGDASPRSSLAFFSPSVASSTRRALALALTLLRNAVKGRSSGTDHMPSSMSANAAARRSLTAPRSRPKSSVAMMSNVSSFMSGSTATARRPAHRPSRWRATSASIAPTYRRSMSGLRNCIMAPRTRR
uniref:Uncharacterized protein n=1 Tax=Zea mays TaxID=4577 RepID=B4FFN8_MAIZE|nr:unknown [Zea mays]